MGLSFRRRKKIGGVNLSLSNRGLGASVGRRGARVSSRGWLSLSGLGLLFRKKIR